jgi:hypothetical protein
MNFNDDPALTVQHICLAIRPLLRGFPAEIQGAVLAELTSMWLAGHMGPGADRVREELLDMHVTMIRDLIPEQEREILARCPPSGHG